jgi:hypothetical protein
MTTKRATQHHFGEAEKNSDHFSKKKEMKFPEKSYFRPKIFFNNLFFPSFLCKFRKKESILMHFRIQK